MSFEYPEEQLNNKEEKEGSDFEVEENINKDIEDNIKKGFLDRAKDIAIKNKISESALKGIVKEEVLNGFKSRHHKDTLDILDYYEIEPDFLKSEAFDKLGEERAELKLSQGDVKEAREALKDLNIDEKYLETEEALEAAKKGIKSILSTDDIDKAVEIKEFFNIDNAFMSEAVKEEIEIRLKDDLTVGATSLQKKFNIPDDFMKEAIKKEVLSRLSLGRGLEGIAHFITEMKMDTSFLADEEILEAIGERIRNMFDGYGQEKIPDIFKGI